VPRKFVNPLIDHELTMSVDCGRKFTAHPHTGSYEEPWGQRGVARPTAAPLSMSHNGQIRKCQEQMDLATSSGKRSRRRSKSRLRTAQWGNGPNESQMGLNRNLVVSKVIS